MFTQTDRVVRRFSRYSVVVKNNCLQLLGYASMMVVALRVILLYFVLKSLLLTNTYKCMQVEMLKSNFLDNRLSKRKNRFLFDYRFSHCTIPPR